MSSSDASDAEGPGVPDPAGERWAQAVSAALDDEQLAAAVERVTTAVPGLGRRSVPLARAQLVTWAAAVHRARAELALADALAAELAAPSASLPAPVDGPLPTPPAPCAPAVALSARLAALLAPDGETADAPASATDDADPRGARVFPTVTAADIGRRRSPQGRGRRAGRGG